MPQLFYLSEIPTASVPIFVNNWCDKFPVHDADIYAHTISKPAYSADELREILEWRSAKDKKSRNVLLQSSELINTIKAACINNTKARNHELLPSAVAARFPKIGTEWKLFLLHLLHPLHFPYWDKKTEAAFYYLLHGNASGFGRKKTERIYLQSYLPYLEAHFYEIPPAKTDRAMQAFGAYLLEQGRKD